MAEQLETAPPWRERGVAFALYLSLSAIGHLVWEIVQLPLYGLWRTASNGELAFAVLHCTAGDLLIATSVLLTSLVVSRAWRWPRAQALHIAALAIPLGIAYTGFSEWLNVYVRQSWIYDPAMPTMSVLGYQIGLSPLAQWLFVPAVVFFCAGVNAQVVPLNRAWRTDAEKSHTTMTNVKTYEFERNLAPLTSALER